jgi:type II secretory pathway pseudopilin PulG
MAIHPIMISAVHPRPVFQQSVNVAARTEQATESSQSVDLAADTARRVPRGTTVTLTVPLDERPESQAHKTGASQSHSSRQVHTTQARSEPMRRDSLKRREALLKGKEGSRQRRRWENGMSFHGRMI